MEIAGIDTNSVWYQAKFVSGPSGDSRKHFFEGDLTFAGMKRAIVIDVYKIAEIKYCAANETCQVRLVNTFMSHNTFDIESTELVHAFASSAEDAAQKLLVHTVDVRERELKRILDKERILDAEIASLMGLVRKITNGEAKFDLGLPK